ncbi:MAG: polyhydroxyalkanoate depolymerase [Holosporales bacterium]
MFDSSLKSPHPSSVLDALMAQTSRLMDMQKDAEMTAYYYLRDMQDLSLTPVHYLSTMGRRTWANPFNLSSFTSYGRTLAAQYETLERSTKRFMKPSFDIDSVLSQEGQLFEIKEHIVKKRTFCDLIHFERIPVSAGEGGRPKSTRPVPSVLVVAPYSGHYATLLRDTVRTLLKDHDVYITDWKNARDIPLSRGLFDLEKYISYLMDFLKSFDRPIHLVAVCQPAVPVLALASLWASADHPLQPLSMTLMGGPIDTRVNPTKVNKAAHERPHSWFEKNVIARVPVYYPGSMRRVMPGFLMLSGFMSLNLERHMSAQMDHFGHLVRGDQDDAEAHRKFYDEYRSVLDLPADYFLDSVRTAFQEHLIPNHKMTWKGHKVEPQAITKTALLTVEGENDDISGAGQTYAAHELCRNLDKTKQHHHLQKGVGHYGVFNGRRFRDEIYPVIRNFIATHNNC